jgi:hypothetical protein
VTLYNKLIHALPQHALNNFEIDDYMEKMNLENLKYMGCFSHDTVPKDFYNKKKNKKFAVLQIMKIAMKMENIGYLFAKLMTIFIFLIVFIDHLITIISILKKNGLKTNDM